LKVGYFILPERLKERDVLFVEEVDLAVGVIDQAVDLVVVLLEER
jgi:hypothetical protein